jgi:excisionase family DNA binding protein
VSSVVFGRLDDKLAAQMALAIRSWRRRGAREHGIAPHPDLEAIERALLGGTGAVTTGPEGTEPVGVGSGPDADGLLTYEEAASVLRISTKTLRRRVAAGDVATVALGRRRLFRRQDLEAFAGRSDAA